MINIVPGDKNFYQEIWSIKTFKEIFASKVEFMAEKYFKINVGLRYETIAMISEIFASKLKFMEEKPCFA